jgi:selenocysteine lyase/cysteine desulfurase
MLTCQSDSFSLDPAVHYLNCAYMSPLPLRVEEAGIRAIRAKRNPALIQQSDFFSGPQSVKRLFAQLIGAENASSISLLPSVSYGIATAAKNVPVRKGQNIVLLHEQFPSNVYTWQRVASDARVAIRTVKLPSSGTNRSRAWTDAILEQIDSDTAVVAMPIVHWTDGTLFDVAAIGRKAHKFGAALILDGTQSVGALPFDVQEVRPDALIVGGYKWLMGPYSCGLAYWGDRFANGVPLEENWINRLGSENFAGLVDYQAGYELGATRFDVGEKSNFALLPMLNEALCMLLEWGPQNIQNYLSNLLQPWEDSSRNLGFQLGPSSSRGSHLFGLHLPPNLDVERVKNALISKSVSVSVRGKAIRVAPHVYNTSEDMQALVDALEVSLTY